MPSELLTLPGAVPADGRDREVAAHYGSFFIEQRTLAAGEGFVDLSHREVVAISGPDRLTLLHNLTTQHLAALPPGVATQALILSPHGHIEHHFYGVDDGEVFTAHTEPGAAAGLVEFLVGMRFMMRVEAALQPERAVMWRPGGFDVIARSEVHHYAQALGPAAGLWAYDALRIARGEPRFGLDTDHRTIPNEVGWIPSAVHLDKGCYRGQETVARVHTLGRPPRRLVLLHLDGSEIVLPAPGAEVLTADGKAVGLLGSVARHHEWGPIGLALIKRNVPVDAPLSVAQIAAAQEVIVDPEVGLHVRPKLK